MNLQNLTHKLTKTKRPLLGTYLMAHALLRDIRPVIPHTTDSIQPLLLNNGGPLKAAQGILLQEKRGQMNISALIASSLKA